MHKKLNTNSKKNTTSQNQKRSDKMESTFASVITQQSRKFLAKKVRKKDVMKIKFFDVKACSKETRKKEHNLEIICISTVKTLRLNRHRPSTAWGVQKRLLQLVENEYFKSGDGTYQFEFDTGNGQHQMFRSEKRFTDGTIVGFYGYIDPEGILRITEYLAGRYGYKQRSILRYLV